MLLLFSPVFGHLGISSQVEDMQAYTLAFMWNMHIT
jgi:hypothetical protein